MNFNIKQEELNRPLQRVASVVERRLTKPILGNILLSLQDGLLRMTTTDMEIEMQTQVQVDSGTSGDITVQARKLMDICRSLPGDADLKFTLDDQRMVLKAGKSRFTLATLPAIEFPNIEIAEELTSFKLPEGLLKTGIDRTAFAMAQQDVRYYLNGLLMEIHNGSLRLVATDGHRLAICDVFSGLEGVDDQRLIIPRKGILELSRLLSDGDAETTITLGRNFIRVTSAENSFVCKLIEGVYPDYQNVIPNTGDKDAICDRETLRQALNRVAILSSEKYRGVRMHFADSTLLVIANNPEHEEAEDELPMEYVGGELDIAFNVGYLIDALTACDGEKVKLNLSDANSCCLIETIPDNQSRYVVMPMRL